MYVYLCTEPVGTDIKRCVEVNVSVPWLFVLPDRCPDKSFSIARKSTHSKYWFVTSLLLKWERYVLAFVYLYLKHNKHLNKSRSTTISGLCNGYVCILFCCLWYMIKRLNWSFSWFTFLCFNINLHCKHCFGAYNNIRPIYLVNNR